MVNSWIFVSVTDSLFFGGLMNKKSSAGIGEESDFVGFLCFCQCIEFSKLKVGCCPFGSYLLKNVLSRKIRRIFSPDTSTLKLLVAIFKVMCAPFSRTPWHIWVGKIWSVISPKRLWFGFVWYIHFGENMVCLGSCFETINITQLVITLLHKVWWAMVNVGICWFSLIFPSLFCYHWVVIQAKT